MTKQIVTNTPLDPYGVRVVQTPDGLVQVTSTDKFPEVPLAVSCAITYDGNNSPLTQVFKDALGHTLATKTLTWVSGNCTLIAWS